MMAIRRAIWFTILMAVKLVVLYVRVVRVVLRWVGRFFGGVELGRVVEGLVRGLCRRASERCFGVLVWILLGFDVKSSRNARSGSEKTTEAKGNARQSEHSMSGEERIEVSLEDHARPEAGVNNDSISPLQLVVEQEDMSASRHRALAPIPESDAPYGLLARPSKAYLRKSHTRHCSLEIEHPRSIIKTVERKRPAACRSHRRNRSCSLWWPQPFHPDEKGGLYGTYAVGT